jgi:hypothetical protein
MLARWLVGELGSGSIADYYDLPERYLWAKIAVAAGAPRPEADYISLPKNYAWSDIYNAVSGDIANSAILVSGAGIPSSNGTYVKTGFAEGKPLYNSGLNTIAWSSSDSHWYINDDEGIGDVVYISNDNTSYPWQATNWTPTEASGIPPAPILTPQTPNHTDWSEKQALGHIAAAYRGDTGNAGALATYIDWPWRYQVASIIGGIFPSNGLLAFWKLADLTDASGNGNTLTNNNGVTFVAGKIGNAASLSKTNGSYLTSNVVFNTTNTNFGISVWVNIQANAGNTVFLGTGTSGAWGFNLQSNNVMTFNNAAAGNLEFAGFVRNVWTHVAATNENGTISLYVNGVLADSGTWDGYANSPDVRLQSAFGDQQGDLLMDAVGLWSRALTSREIAQLYNNGNGLEP